MSSHEVRRRRRGEKASSLPLVLGLNLGLGFRVQGFAFRV